MLEPIVHADPGDENDYTPPAPPCPQTCEACGQWSAGTALQWGRRLCGRASCLRVGLADWLAAS